MPADPSLLRDIPLFASLDDEERGLLAGFLDVHTVAAGEALFRTGDPGQSMFVVARGAVELFIKDTAGQKIVLTQALPGDTFGELALLDAGARTATATVVEAAELIELDREDLLLLFGRRPEAALHMLGAVGAMTRKADLLLRTRVARNANTEAEEKVTRIQALADAIARFSGSVPFLGIHALWFVVWIALNVLGVWVFDPFPFGLLTMIVSLEAIFLSCLLLIATDRQAAKDRVRADIEYDINVKAELEIAHLHEKIDEMREDVFRRLQRIEQAVHPTEGGVRRSG
jgi:CRP/FNR family cyclic AMP-dependent transcriptional regulator